MHAHIAGRTNPHVHAHSASRADPHLPTALGVLSQLCAPANSCLQVRALKAYALHRSGKAEEALQVGQRLLQLLQ